VELKEGNYLERVIDVLGLNDGILELPVQRERRLFREC
jgi:hypothetical protein